MSDDPQQNPADDFMVLARLEGYSWDEIHDHLQDQNRVAKYAPNASGPVIQKQSLTEDFKALARLEGHSDSQINGHLRAQGAKYGMVF